MSRLIIGSTWTEGATAVLYWLLPLVPAPLVIQSLEAAKNVYRAGSREVLVLHATDNREIWSYRIDPAWEPETITHPITRQESTQWRRSFPKSSPVTVTDHQDHVLAKYIPAAHLGVYRWALKDIAARSALPASDPDALQIGVVYSRKAGKAAGAESREVKRDGVTYAGWPKAAGGRSLDAFHQIVLEGLHACAKVWNGWRPTGLFLEVFKGRAAMGLAYAPGTGPEKGKTRVAFNTHLLTQYSDEAFWRVLVHELCHHARAETGRSYVASPEWDAAWKQLSLEKQQEVLRSSGSHRRALRDSFAGLQDHDPVFLHMLSLVDAKVRPEAGKSGVWFTEFTDPALAAESSAKRQAAAARREARADQVRYAPGSGRIFVYHTKSKGTRFDWVPMTKGAFPITSYYAGDLPRFANEKVLGGDYGTDAAAALAATPVTYDPVLRGGLFYSEQPNNLLDVLKDLLKYPWMVKQIGYAYPNIAFLFDRIGLQHA